MDSLKTVPYQPDSKREPYASDTIVVTVETESAAPLVLEFGAIGDDAVAVVGGKAANLGVLTRAGLPVPPGVCVTTDAYRQVAAGASVSDILDAIA